MADNLLPVTMDVAAEREARDAYLWYLDRDPRVALRFEAEINKSLARIAEAPLSFPEVEPGVRRVLLSRFPYALLYSVEESGIIVLVIGHTRRRPGHWHTDR